MLVSIKNLSKLVDLSNLSAEEIAHGLTFSGIEVEEISTLASGTNLVIGHILECEKHPDSDHLHILKVDLGEKYGVNQIVCGAPNARKGLKVIVARVGAKLVGGEIKPSVIRGVESNGMCCSLLELGVDKKYLSEAQCDGIEELPEDAPVGEEDVLGYLSLDDQILNLSILANRPDLLSLENIAREVGAIFHRQVSLPKIEELNTFKSELTVGSMTDKCPQFKGKEVRDIKVKKSPKWMEEFLTSMGVRSINNIVDIGNYVMLMTGQPLHMYDADKLHKKELIVKADLDVDFVALDEKTYKIIPGDICITSNNEVMCLGGVMGSLACQVDEKTKNVYIEAACFDSATIRHTSNRLGLASESSMRFVKGTNHQKTQRAIDYTAKLLKELCEAKEFGDTKTYNSEEIKENVISSSVTRINNRLGTKFSEKEVKNVLESLGFEIKELDEDKFTAKVPDYRLDVTCDADLSEEVIRILGFKHVNSVLPCLDTTLGALNDAQLKERRIREYLNSRGLDECLTYSLISEKEIALFDIVNHDEPYSLLNPLTDERKLFRRNILHSLLKVASYNVNHQNKDLALFEVSNVYTKNEEERQLSIVLVGNELRQNYLEQKPYDFYHMKGLVNGMMAVLGIEKTRYQFKEATSNLDEFHPYRSADVIIQGKKVGTFGELHPNKLKEYDFGKTSVIALEVNLDAIISLKTSIIKAKSYTKFPVVTRDLAFVVKKNVSIAEIIKVAASANKALIKDIYVFDVYEGSNIQEGYKSIAITITYGADDHTLLDKEVNDAEENIKFALSNTLKANFRM